MKDQYKEGFFAEIKGFIEKHAENKAAFVAIYYGDEHGLLITPKDVASIRMDDEFLVVTWSEKHPRKNTESRVRFAAITRVDFGPTTRS
jgi:hypothetical protein